MKPVGAFFSASIREHRGFRICTQPHTVLDLAHGGHSELPRRPRQMLWGERR
jgi:hypothetical protein